MKVITEQTRAAWLNPEKVGDIRPMVRATIQRVSMALTPYTNISVNPLERLEQEIKGGVPGTFASLMIGQPDIPVELPNIKSFTWTRSVTQEVAEATMELYNTEVLPMGTTPDEDTGGYELPGWFTYRHGYGDTAARWAQVTNGWRDYLVPDRMVRTWEGYGFNASVAPEKDSHMYPSGTWLIDDVVYNANGIISVKMRDVGRLLIDQIAFPPVVSFDEYPVSFEPYHDVDNPDVLVESERWFTPNYHTDSNISYIGSGFTDGGRPYVDSRGGVNGHYGRHAFDDDESTYWLSVGNYPNWSSAFEWVQGRFSERTVGAVRFRPWAGPYKVYISIYANGDWKGKKKIPYKSRAIDADTDIPFVKSVRVKKGAWKTVKLPKEYNNATRIRLTFTDLYDSGIGQYRYRAGLRSMEVSRSVTRSKDGGTHIEGDFNDFTMLIKRLLAWGGYYWPQGVTGRSTIRHSDAETITLLQGGTSTFDDPDLHTTAGGGVWGDFENTGTAPLTELPIEVFDKKPLLDAILHIRDIVGFLFLTDEQGGAIWRSPNIWQVGNYLSSTSGGPNAGRTGSVIEIRDDQLITDLGATISSRNIRDSYVIGTANGEYGATVDGFNPYPANLRRTGMWTSQYFKDNEECQIMADLISVRAMYTYRVNSLSIPGNPAIQIDDQVRLAERITAETFLHYVQSINSSFDMDTRVWTYDLETFWLGEQPFEIWAFDPNDVTKLSNATRDYLRTMGKLGPGIALPDITEEG